MREEIKLVRRGRAYMGEKRKLRGGDAGSPAARAKWRRKLDIEEGQFVSEEG